MQTAVSVADLSAESRLIDVRTPSEFAAGHIAGAINIPLDQIESRVADLYPDTLLVLVCKAGTRARMAAELVAPCRAKIAVLEGGMDAWYHSGGSVVASSRTRWSLERQVRLGAGVLVLSGFIASLVLNPRWIFLAAFVGAGLTFAGLTDICAMGAFLARMPWNRASKLEAFRENDGQTCALKH